jgi:hypothetical protein
VFAATAVMACGGGPDGPSPPAGNGRQELTSAFFQFSYPAGEATSIRAVAEAADAGAPGILSELGAEGMPRVRVTYYASRTALADAVRPMVGEIPSFATGLVTSSTQIHLLSSADPVARKTTTLLHEFAHCASMHRNPSIPNDPRWLWETIAIYAARDRGDAARLAAVLAGPQPTVAQLNAADGTAIYDVGFSIGEYIVERGGLEALRQLLLSNGDTRLAFGVAPDQFLAEWFAWARAH